MTAPTVFSIVCIALGIVFMFAGLAKIMSFSAFRLVLAEFEFVPTRFITVLASAIIVVECMLGLAFLTGTALSVTLILGLCVNGMFTLVTHSTGSSEESHACFCFGHDGVRTNSWKSGIRTALILGGAATALLIWYFAPNVVARSMTLEIGAIASVLVLVLAWFTDIPDLLSVSQ